MPRSPSRPRPGRPARASGPASAGSRARGRRWPSRSRRAARARGRRRREVSRAPGSRASRPGPPWRPGPRGRIRPGRPRQARPPSKRFRARARYPARHRARARARGAARGTRAPRRLWPRTVPPSRAPSGRPGRERSWPGAPPPLDAEPQAMIALVQVYLRALGLVGQSVAIGGAVLGFLVLRPWLLRERDVERDIGRALGTVAMGAALAAACQVGTDLAVLASTAGPDGWPVTQALGTPLFFAALARVLLFGAVMATCALVRGSPRSRARWLALVALAAAATASAAWISHAVGRLDRGALFLALDAAHQLAAGVWVGSLVHLLVLAWRRVSRPWPAETLRRFSLVAQGAVVTLAAAAVGLWLLYIGGPGAALGTAYGAMTLTKSVLFLGLLGLGALNFLAARRLRGDAQVPPLTLRDRK